MRCQDQGCQGRTLWKAVTREAATATRLKGISGKWGGDPVGGWALRYRSHRTGQRMVNRPARLKAGMKGHSGTGNTLLSEQKCGQRDRRCLCC